MKPRHAFSIAGKVACGFLVPILALAMLRVTTEGGFCGAVPAAAPPPPGTSSGWLAEAERNIAAWEHHVTLQALPGGAGGKAWHAANREQNLRAWFTEGGLKLVPRDTRSAAELDEAEARLKALKGGSAPGADACDADPAVDANPAEPGPNWELELTLRAWGRDGAMNAPAMPGDKTPEATANQIEFKRGGMEEWFVNDPKGLKQNFRIDCAPDGGTGALVVEYDLRTDMKPRLMPKGEGIEFSDARGRRVLRYRDLVAEDAQGMALAGRMELKGGLEKGSWTLRLVVEDSGAAYPVTVDPLFSGIEDAMIESDQANARLGVSVAGAGDVNGDGYDDVIVGAYQYDDGQTDEGAAFIFLGSASGVSTGNPTTADTVLESNEANGQFGVSVAGAGDVNGDGYADVIIGELNYTGGAADTKEGGAFIYLGSPSGISGTGTDLQAWETAATTLEANQANAGMGISVAGAGDVDGDGYADVIVGAHQYDNGQTNEGAAFIFLGSPSGVESGAPATAAAILESNQANALMGVSVAGAGDVNGDGYGDVIVGAYGYSNGQANEGGAFVFLGSSSGVASGNPSTAAAILESNQASAYLGVGVAGAGDVNGDGYADVIVGALYYDNGEADEGAAFVFMGSASGVHSGNPSTAAATLESNQMSAYMGIAVAGAGDVNGDGYADVIVGAYKYDNGQADEGAAFVFLGSASGVASGNPATAGAVFEADQAGANVGTAVAGAGDVNGDGYADVIIGAPNYADGQAGEGAAFILLGSASGVASGNPATADATFEANQINAQMGVSVAGAGDVNGDGYDDVIVGAIYYDSGEPDEGAAFIFLGSSSGLDAGNPATAAAMLQSNQAYARMGISVAGARDVNGDGYDDVIVGAGSYSQSGNHEGAAFVFLGSAAGVASGNPSNASAILDSNQNSSGMGYSVAGAGDVNGDGYADVIVGASFYGGGGGAFVFLGGASGVASGNPSTAATVLSSDQTQSGAEVSVEFGHSVAGAGDVNGDGYADVIVGAPYYDTGDPPAAFAQGAAFIFLGSASGVASGISSSAVAEFTGSQDSANLGYSVAGAGDVDGDGYADVIVGVPHLTLQTNGGGALIFSGSPSFNTFSAPATVLYSDQDGAEFGNSVAGAGDVNGDGYADVIVGAPSYSNGQAGEGAAFVFLGSPGEIGWGDASSAAAMLESDQAGSKMGYLVAGAGDVNGDGYADVIVGAPTYDSGETDEGAAFVFYGNNGHGLSPAPRQRRASNAAPVGIGLKSDSTSGFRLAALARSPYGRANVKLEWEIKPLGTLLDGAGLQQSADWSDTGTPGAALNELVGGLASGTMYHWRLRILNRPQIAPWTAKSRWMNQSPDGWQLADIRTKGTPPPTPTPSPSATRTPTPSPSATPSPTASPTASPTLTATPYDGRPLGDFDSSGCTDLDDFLLLLDYWQAVSPFGGAAIGVDDFLALLDNWQTGPTCP